MSIRNSFVVMTCSQTMKLMHGYARTYGVWTPADKDLKLLMPGYVFVPYENFMEMMRRVPGWFNLRVMQYDLIGRPSMVTLQDLRQIIRVSERIEQKPEAENTPFYRQGDKVRFSLGGHKVEGIFDRMRKDGNARIRISQSFRGNVDIHPSFLEKI